MATRKKSDSVSAPPAAAPTLSEMEALALAAIGGDWRPFVLALGNLPSESFVPLMKSSLGAPLLDAAAMQGQSGALSKISTWLSIADRELRDAFVERAVDAYEAATESEEGRWEIQLEALVIITNYMRVTVGQALGQDWLASYPRMSRLATRRYEFLGFGDELYRLAGAAMRSVAADDPDALEAPWLALRAKQAEMEASRSRKTFASPREYLSRNPMWSEILPACFSCRSWRCFDRLLVLEASRESDEEAFTRVLAFVERCDSLLGQEAPVHPVAAERVLAAWTAALAASPTCDRAWLTKWTTFDDMDPFAQSLEQGVRARLSELDRLEIIGGLPPEEPVQPRRRRGALGESR